MADKNSRRRSSRIEKKAEPLYNDPYDFQSDSDELLNSSSTMMSRRYDKITQTPIGSKSTRTSRAAVNKTPTRSSNRQSVKNRTPSSSKKERSVMSTSNSSISPIRKTPRVKKDLKIKSETKSSKVLKTPTRSRTKPKKLDNYECATIPEKGLKVKITRTPIRKPEAKIPSKRAKTEDPDFNSGEATTESDSEESQESEYSESNESSDNEWENSSKRSRKSNKSYIGNDEDEDMEDLENANLNQSILKRLQLNVPHNSQSDLSATQMEPMNTESYFLAQTRLKFKSDKKEMVAANDAKKGKKPRKGKRGLGGATVNNLPVRQKSNFSVTKEATRAATNVLLPRRINKHEEEIENLLTNSIKPDFPRWIFLMKCGFNIVLHGYGSKVPVFHLFKAYLDSRSLVITINGLYPKINPRKFLVDLCDSLELDNKIRVSGTNMEVVSQEVANELSKLRLSSMFLIVRNFDSLAINHPPLLTVICSLARVKWIHILASVDNVNAFHGVNQNQTIQLNFCWIPCSTFQPYEEELTWVPGVFGEATSGSGGENTLQYVLKSLTGNARKAFSILASIQLNAMQGFKRKKKATEFPGVEFRELARRCRESFVAHSDAALKTLLVEFFDHKLVTRQGKTKSAGNFLTIDLDVEILEKIVKESN